MKKLSDIIFPIIGAIIFVFLFKQFYNPGYEIVSAILVAVFGFALVSFMNFSMDQDKNS